MRDSQRDVFQGQIEIGKAFKGKDRASDQKDKPAHEWQAFPVAVFRQLAVCQKSHKLNQKVGYHEVISKLDEAVIDNRCYQGYLIGLAIRILLQHQNRNAA